MPKNRWDVLVDVYLRSDNPLDFWVESYLQDAPGGHLNFNNNGHPGFDVNFEFHDETGQNYRLPKKDKDALWSRLGPKANCPTGPCWEVFEEDSVNVKNKGTRVVAYNPNPFPAQGEFQYRLNVSITGDPPYLALDPGGTNNNGNSA